MHVFTVEGFNRQLRKVTKSKTVFPSDDSLLKMLYLATMDITKKWTGHRHDWGQVHSQLEIYFEERLAGITFTFIPCPSNVSTIAVGKYFSSNVISETLFRLSIDKSIC